MSAWMNSMLLSDYPIVYDTKVKSTKRIQLMSEYTISKAQFNQEARRLGTALIKT